MDTHADTAPCWRALPPELLRHIGACLPLADVLPARCVCAAWAGALAPLPTRLRVHVAAQPLQAASPGQLAGALQRLPGVAEVVLVLSSHTSAAALAEALEAVGRQSRVHELTLWELPPISGAPQPRSYAPGLRLAPLRHVRALSIRSLSWTLQELWQQVAELQASAPPPGAALTSLAISHADGESVGGVACPELPPAAALPPALRHVATPLPGQRDARGAVACSLAASHNSYLTALSASLPQLLSLRLGGCFQGVPQALRFTQLCELHMCFGGLFRSFLLHDDTDEASLSLQTLQAVGSHLRTLSLLGVEQLLPRIKCSWLQHAPQLQHLTSWVLLDGEDVAPAPRLRSLEALCHELSPELLHQLMGVVGAQLSSLSLWARGDAPRTAAGALTPREACGSRAALPPRGGPLLAIAHTQALHVQPALAGRPQLAGLVSLALVSAGRTLLTVPEPAALWSGLPCLRRLRLQQVGLGWSAHGTPPQQLRLNGRGRSVALFGQAHGARVSLSLEHLPPRLQSLELGRFYILLAPSNSGSGDGSSSGGCGGLLRSLEQLVLVDTSCLLELGSASAAAASSGAGAAGPSSHASASSAAAGTSAVVGGSVSGDSGAPALEVRHAPLASLLALCGAPLRELEVLECAACAADLEQLSSSELAPELRRLHVRGEWQPASPPGSAAGTAAAQQRQSPVAVLAAGRMRQLRDLALDLRPAASSSSSSSSSSSADEPGMPITVLQECCGLSRLTRLSLALDVRSCSAAPRRAAGQAAPEALAADLARSRMLGSRSDAPAGSGAWGLCTCSASPGAGMPAEPDAAWRALAALQQLRMLELVLRVPPGAGLGPPARCGRCGGGAGLAAVRHFFKHELPCLLPLELCYREEERP